MIKINLQINITTIYRLGIIQDRIIGCFVKTLPDKTKRKPFKEEKVFDPIKSCNKLHNCQNYDI